MAWVPLAPRETYYGYGNHGRYSTNITNVNINQVRVTNVYRNVVANVREDFSKQRNIVVGRPPIKPVETSYIPVVRAIPEAKRPPAAVRKVDAKELRQSRPLVKEPDRSAIRPQATPAPLEVKKVEKPRPASERATERKEAVPRERRGPAASQGSPPEKVQPRVAPKEAEPKATGKPERAQPPPEKAKPEPAQRGGPPEKVEPRGKPKEAEPKATGKPGRPQGTPADNVRSEDKGQEKQRGNPR